MDLLVNIDVDDLSKAIDFYRKAVGLRVGRRFGALSVVVAGVSTYWVYRIGHTGAKAVWTTVQQRIDTGLATCVCGTEMGLAD